MALNTTIVDLARKITAAAEVIDGFTTENNFSLSFDADSADPATLHGENAQAYQQARITAVEAATEMNALLSGNNAVFLDLCTYYHAASALRAVLTFNLASSIPLTGSTTYEAIAQKTDTGNLDKKTIQRLFAILTSYHIFKQPSPGHIAHTRLSKAMLTNPSLSAMVQFGFEEVYGFSYHLVEALKKWGPSEEPNETGFNASTGSEATFYEYIDEKRNQGKSSSFTAMLEETAEYEFWDMDVVVRGLEWEGVDLLVDVAGSVGHVSIELAKRYEHLQFIVQDYDTVIRRGEDALPAELKDRIKFEAKDIFEKQETIPGKKVVYFLRAILHNWSDKYARRILQAIVPAMKPEDRIVINEQIVSDGTSLLTERMARFSDMTMWAGFNGQERTAEQFEELVRSVPGLEIVQISPGLGLGIVEICSDGVL
ncbi:hypothetical protein ASPVEDRAFT_38184 [Aspergillus versicolor CBS 583.65]|uniref:O-methyltransferase C-terminal domain-containing protein n=1 Tax=Aspergillus versicolor CBS 583.65 TaxID=1036611 RepID=A0A1L9PAW3_ASPVE|nr:uncharacterized protein ASPVEDRAFT_38184 [Aspergillus versicolor CBS 583.65]OJI98670.1 hypothetical protein ASPVEDRAFT_38184 [Aspergillus versicolor CBS 583.65]